MLPRIARQTALLTTTAIVTALAIGPAPAHAADPTAQAATALEGQLRSWIQGMAGPGTTLGERPVQVSAEGDHYTFSIPIGVAKAGSPPPSIRGTARPTEGGRWSFEGPYLPSPFTFTLDMQVPPLEGQKSAAPTVPVTYTVTGTSQNQGVFDPSFATPSTMSTSASGLQVVAASDTMNQKTVIERSASTSTIRPAGTDRADFVTEGTIEGYTLHSERTDTPPVDVKVDRVRVSGGMLSVSRDRVAQMVPALMRITGGAMAGMPKGGMKIPAGATSVDPQLIRTLVQSLQDFASEFTLDESFDGVTIAFGGSGGSAKQVRIGMGAKSDAGLLAAHMEFGLDGLALPDLSLGAMASLLPQKVAMRPAITGVPVAELLNMLSAAGTSKEAGPPPEFVALLNRGTVGAGLDSFSFDSGGAVFTGMGKVAFLDAQSMDGQAQVTATNFDALMQRLNGMPDVADALPVLLFVKGIGRTVENRIVWDITYRGNKLLVNGTDLSAMTGGK